MLPHREKPDIFGFPHLIHCWDTAPSTPADFSGAPWCTQIPYAISSRTSVICCPTSTPRTDRKYGFGSQKPLAQTSHLKSSAEISIIFFPPLAPSKVFFNEGELNDFSQKSFLVHYILQLDRPWPRPVGYTWTHHLSEGIVLHVQALGEIFAYASSDVGKLSNCTVLIVVSVLSKSYCQLARAFAPSCHCANGLSRNTPALFCPQAPELGMSQNRLLSYCPKNSSRCSRGQRLHPTE